MARALASASSQKLQNDNAVVTDVPLTIAGWMRTASTATTQVACAVGHRSGSSGARYQLYFTSGGRIGAYCQNGGGTQTATITDSSGVNYSANTWYHGAAVFSSTTSRTVYRDGANSATDTNTVTVGTVTTTTLGARYDGVGFGIYLNGRLAEFAIWNVALSADEIYSLSRGISPHMVRPEALVWHPELYGNSSPEPDSVGGYHMTVTGATKAAHDIRMVYPSSSRIILPAAAVGGGFKAAWARNANMVIQ